MDPSIQQEIERLPEAPSASFVVRLAERLGAHTSAATVFGEPVERGGVTVIPVARATWGFGGGEGRVGRNERSGGGGGGGGGAIVTPVGYIEMTESGARYHPIRQLSAYVPLLLAGGALLLGLGRLIVSSRKP